MLILVRTPKVLLLLVWPLSLSLATTREISVDFSSSSYLDVSVQRVPFINLCIQLMIYGSSPYVFPHSEICGYNAYLQLPAAYRSLSRLSSAPDAKAFSLCSCLLELLLINIFWILVLGSLYIFLSRIVEYSLKQFLVKNSPISQLLVRLKLFFITLN